MMQPYNGYLIEGTALLVRLFSLNVAMLFALDALVYGTSSPEVVTTREGYGSILSMRLLEKGAQPRQLPLSRWR
jgi:hypothetical protein